MLKLSQPVFGVHNWSLKLERTVLTQWLGKPLGGWFPANPGVLEQRASQKSCGHSFNCKPRGRRAPGAKAAQRLRQLERRGAGAPTAPADAEVPADAGGAEELRDAGGAGAEPAEEPERERRERREKRERAMAPP